MPQPTATPVNPSDPLQTRGGKPARQDDTSRIILDLQKRVDALEKVLSGGLLLTAQNGVTVRLTIDNSGNPVWIRQ